MYYLVIEIEMIFLIVYVIIGKFNFRYDTEEGEEDSE